MKKSTLLMVLSLVLALALGVGGTMAYLQDTDADVNVMTLGNVYITQNEQEYNAAGELVEFTQDKPLYPYVGQLGWKNKEVADGAYRQFTMNNVVDKYVTVTNTGKSDAYVRTFIALEMGDYTVEEFEMIGVSINAENGGEFKFPGTWVWGEDFVVEIDGNNYYVMVAEHQDALAPGETTIPSLNQIYLKNTAGNEEVEKLDGNGNGKYDVLVLSQAVQTQGFADANESGSAADEALNEAFPYGTEKAATVAGWFGEAEVGTPGDKNDTNNPPTFTEHWDGTVDTDWYNDTDTEFVLNTAEELAGLAKLVDEGNTFEGKTVKLGTDLCLGCDNEDCCADENGEVTSFDPIGSYRFEKSFMGTFDGQNNTIYKLTQTTWALDNGYSYNDCGLGLFGAVEDGTVKNLVIDGANISGESAICGTVAAVAEDATFENITVKNSNVADYQYYAGGIVGWASGEQDIINCNVEESTTIGGQWGDFNNANGGVIGGISTKATIVMKDCNVACRIDVPNDVVSAYEWRSYRRSGMLIGDSGQTETDEAVTTAAAPNLTCENVTVTYGDWANYTYCQFNAMNYPWVRVQEGISVDAYSNVRYGNPTDANGDKVVDDNHVHNDGEAHHELIVFDQLYGGKTGDRYCTYGKATHDGVNVVYNNK